MPTVIVGAEVKGKPNFITIAYCGIVQHNPPMIAITSGKAHYTNQGIKTKGCFSVNIPSTAMVAITDYCGLVSGKDIDKSMLFTTFVGKLKRAPMIQECSINLECSLTRTIDLGGANEVFIGEIVEVYADESILVNGLPDIRKIDPIIFSMHDNNYWQVGKHIGKAWDIGRRFERATK